MPEASGRRPTTAKPTVAVVPDVAETTKARTVNAPSQRINVALPFSQIKLQEASAELRDLADLLVEVIEALSDSVPEHRLAPLRDKAEALRARMR
ncbi:MAG TPA: hypothetical protein VIY26_16695 [Acidimicrobiales bacterium]